MMKKMVVIGLVVLGVGAASGLGVQAHIDQASAARTTVVPRNAKAVSLSKPAATAKPKTSSAIRQASTTKKTAGVSGEQTVAKKTQAAKASEQLTKSTPAAQKAQAKPAAPVVSSPEKATTTKKVATSPATQTRTTSPVVAQQPALSNFYGTWHNAAVTVTLTATTMTVTQNGQALTSRYQAQAAGDGFIFTPLDHEADALYLVLANGHLEWTTGASTPLVLTK